MKDTFTIEPSKAGHVSQGRKDMRDEQLFARLIGAAVLLALAVIVLPFVLDGSGSQREYEYAETLPSEPARPSGVESSFSSRPDSAVADSSNAVGSDPSGDLNVSQSSDAVAGSLLPQRREVQVTIPPVTPTPDLQPVKVASVNGQARTTAELAGNVASATDGGPLRRNSGLSTEPLKRGWNIQVASFVRDANALTLINRLRGQNLPAYANEVKGSKRTLIRVLVGPYGNQIDALALQNSIDRDYRVESLMVRGR